MKLKILHKYLLSLLLRNVALSSVSLVILFLIFDFFDRIDNILSSSAGIWIAFQYFFYKIPQFFILTLPIAFIVATLFTYGILSKNSEMTAMRAAGLKLTWLALPLIALSLVFSVINLSFSETIVPNSVRRVKEIYNIDIRRKDQEGVFSQENIWWRAGNNFYSVETFDSRDSSLYDLSKYKVDQNFNIKERVDSPQVNWVNPTLGWNMDKLTEYKFKNQALDGVTKLRSLPLTIKEQPEDFFLVKTEPFSMTYQQLKKFIDQQNEQGLNTKGLMADLKAKISFPFVVFICALAVFPFAIRPARTGSMAASFISGVIICFAYYAVHSFSLALGRAELLSPTIAAWMANFLLLAIGLVLFVGAESPE